ncbi:MAG: hypothetical protein LBE81_10035 [Azonexus sp.]|jgi:hypothetical protein|uniref:hypothetical protein n=1 Tax=Azonexus sp. TaxID=1872668 RepID=UPI0028392CB5|nr:hypothetical protein [Azonexus sp.]MDR0776957.1 hypothetical protein [Azonexus sp.]MDR1994025.1 hypothetical protein [Azonexus sp.]
MRKPRHSGQKISLILACVSGLFTLPALGLFVWLWLTRGLADTWTPSLLAIAAFFVCCAGVLYAMSVPQPVLPPEEEGRPGP